MAWDGRGYPCGSREEVAREATRVLRLLLPGFLRWNHIPVSLAADLENRVLERVDRDSRVPGRRESLRAHPFEVILRKLLRWEWERARKPTHRSVAAVGLEADPPSTDPGDDPAVAAEENEREEWLEREIPALTDALRRDILLWRQWTLERMDRNAMREQLRRMDRNPESFFVNVTRAFRELRARAQRHWGEGEE